MRFPLCCHDNETLLKMSTEGEETYLQRKHAAVQYLKDNNVPECFQNLLNDIAVTKPDDLFGYMAEYFAEQAKAPTIANVKCCEVFSSRGWTSYKVEIDVLLHGKIMSLCSCTALCDTKPAVEIKPMVKGKSPIPGSNTQITDHSIENKDEKIRSLINVINTDIKSSLMGCELYDQDKINKVLKEIISRRKSKNTLRVPIAIQPEVSTENEKTTNNEKSIPNDEAETEEKSAEFAVHSDVLTVSVALIQSASYLQNSQLYRFLYTVIHNQEPNSLFLPTPMIKILSSGKNTAGKLYMIKDVMIAVKNNLPSKQALKQLIDIYRHLELNVQQKPTTNIKADNGALTPAIDKPEQALDLVRDAISGAGYSYEDDVIVAVNFAANEIYDKDKQKYEISTNTFKSCDEWNNLCCDLQERYPEINFLMDPCVSQDVDAWSLLQEKMRGSIITRESFSKNPEILQQYLKEGVVSGNVMKMEDSPTVAQFMEEATNITESPRTLFISPNVVETRDSFIVDVAVTVQADFIIFGPHERSENICKYNRLSAIEYDLNMSNILIKKEPLPPRLTIASPELEKSAAT